MYALDGGGAGWGSCSKVLAAVGGGRGKRLLLASIQLTHKGDWACLPLWSGLRQPESISEMLLP